MKLRLVLNSLCTHLNWDVAQTGLKLAIILLLPPDFLFVNRTMLYMHLNYQ